jgi:DNA (cytosine-5)-methyltransferase 1
LNELALFAGAGGGILGGKLLGWRTICAVERDAYAAQVLAQRQNDGILEAFPIWSDVTTFDGRPWRGLVDVISGGFPCQDISAAGKGAGIGGERSGLWSQMARIVSEVLPKYVFVENSSLLVGRGASVVIGDLASMGYDSAWCCLSASDIGAPHQRDRFWLVANAREVGCSSAIRSPNNGKEGTGRVKTIRGENWIATDVGQEVIALRDRWSDQPNPPSMADGMAYWLDELAASGNGQVPRVAATAFNLLRSRAERGSVNG